MFQSLEVGARGYLLKSTPAKQVAIAIRNVYQGYSQLGPTIAPKVFSQLKAPPTINDEGAESLFNQREIEILNLLGQGCSNREMADALHLSEGTIKNHLTNIFTQLDVLFIHNSGKLRPGDRLIRKKGAIWKSRNNLHLF